MSTTFPTLHSPLERGRLRMRNRTVFPGHQTLFSRDGAVGDTLREYYVERARGGVGAVVIEGGATHPTALKFPDYLRFYDEKTMGALRRLADELHEHDTRAFVQFAHSGSRMATADSRTALWAPSDVRSANAVEIPHAMDRHDMRALIDGYRHSAALVAETGVDGIEIHMAHEYLLGEFLSPYNNRREDEYGGSLENRLRLPLEVIAAVRDVAGDDLVIGVRMNCSDRRPEGNSNEDYVQIAAALDAPGFLDYISVSAGTSQDNGDIVPPMDVEQGVNVKEVAAIRAGIETAAVFAVGRIKRPELAEEILAAGQADVVAMARALIADPEFVNKAANAPETIRPCLGINEGCYGRLTQVRPISCVVNPAVGLEGIQGVGRVPRADAPRSVLVVGAGPAGLQAAVSAAERGHSVTVMEQSTEIGGQLRWAAAIPARREILEIIDHNRRACERLGVSIELGTTFNSDKTETQGYDAIVVATGSVPRDIRVPGHPKGMRVLNAVEAVQHAEETGASAGRVVVLDEVGHMAAYVPAEMYARAGYEVTLVTSEVMIGRAIEETTRSRLLRRLINLGVQLRVSTRIDSLRDQAVDVSHAWSGDKTSLPADLVVLAAPHQADDQLGRELLDRSVVEVHLIGDCLAPRGLLEAISDADAVARSL